MLCRYVAPFNITLAVVRSVARDGICGDRGNGGDGSVSCWFLRLWGFACVGLPLSGTPVIGVDAVDVA